MPFYVYSTITNGVAFCEYEDNASNELAITKRWPDGTPMKVIIEGGHGVSNKHFFTPQGVCTKVSDRDMEILLKNDAFQGFMERGFITYDKKKVAPEKKARDMAPKDKSAPLTPADFKLGKNSDDHMNTYTTNTQKAM